MCNPLAQLVVREAIHREPHGVGDLFGLQFADVGGGTEQEPEVEVLVVGLVLGGIGVDGVDVDVERDLAVRGDDVGRDAGLFGEFTAGRLQERVVGGLDVAAGQQPFAGGVVEDVQDTAVAADEDRACGDVSRQGLAAGEVIAVVEKALDDVDLTLVVGVLVEVRGDGGADVMGMVITC